MRRIKRDLLSHNQDVLNDRISRLYFKYIYLLSIYIYNNYFLYLVIVISNKIWMLHLWPLTIVFDILILPELSQLCLYEINYKSLISVTAFLV